jgi:integration host factor subunit alpha
VLDILDGPDCLGLEGEIEMTLTKERLTDSIFQIVDSKQKAAQIVETLLKMAMQSLENGEDVLLSGFGKFSVKDKNKRRGRNPATGEDLILDSRKVVVFKPSKVLNSKLNNE